MYLSINLYQHPSFYGRKNKSLKPTMNKKGRSSEGNVAQVLQDMVTRHVIKSFCKTKANFPGKDYVVTRNNGQKVGIEVKSSDTGIRKHEKNHGKSVSAVDGQLDYLNLYSALAEVIFH